MYPKLLFCFFLLLFPAVMAVADGTNGSGDSNGSVASGGPVASGGSVVPDSLVASVGPVASDGPVASAGLGDSAGPVDSTGPAEQDAKMVSGMSILGNKEAPMSLFIVPWKSSELGAETNLTRTLNERHVPVDREVFLRELAYYQVSVADNPSAQAVSLLNAR